MVSGQGQNYTSNGLFQGWEWVEIKKKQATRAYKIRPIFTKKRLKQALKVA